MSATTGRGLGEIGPWPFTHLGIVRVYTKAPAVHRTATGRTPRFDGQHVGRGHPVADGDMVALHT